MFENVKKDCSNELKQASVLLKGEAHPNCLTYYCAWMDRLFSQFVIVTELCSGGSLKRVLQQRQLNEAEIWDYFLDALHGLAHIHALKIRHFDIKPENLLITAEGYCCIGDFGVATPVGSEEE